MTPQEFPTTLSVTTASKVREATRSGVACKVCDTPGLESLLPFGPQPVGSRFREDVSEAEERFPVTLGQCRECGLVQLLDPPLAEALRPRFDWISYNEHEDHLDSVADLIAQVPGLPPSPTCVGVSYKDDTLLRRLRERGFSTTWRIEPTGDLDVGPGPTGMETVQKGLTPAAARRLAKSHGRADVVVARHIIEHTTELREFVVALQELASPSGWILLEAPDCARAFDTWDYTTLWEEHSFYFTPKTFVDTVKRLGLDIVEERVYPFPAEDSLVILARVSSAKRAAVTGPPRGEIERARRFADGFPAVRDAWRAWLTRVREREQKVALLGANHFAVIFANLMGLADQIDFIVDDHPRKQGLFLPGTNLRIVASTALRDGGIRTCLLAVNVGSEEAVKNRYRDFLSSGGRFVALFPTSPSGLALHPEHAVPGTRRVSPEVFYANTPIVKVDRATIDALVRQARANPRQRARLCAHPDTAHKLHDMIVAMTRGAYDRPHRHRTRAESLHVVRGEGELVVLDEDGGVKQIVPLGEPSSGRVSFVRMVEPNYHMVVVRSEAFVFHEATTGPFDPKDSLFPPWAPDPSDEAAGRAFVDRISQATRHSAGGSG